MPLDHDPPPAAPAPDRLTLAKEVLAEYRERFPGDARSDDELMKAPNGALEIAGLPKDLQFTRKLRLERLARSARKPEPAPEPKPAIPGESAPAPSPAVPAPVPVSGSGPP